MTLQERYDAEVAAAQALHTKHSQGRQTMITLEQDMIRADARMALLEALLKAEAEAAAVLDTESAADRG